jgi:uncharacterized protein YegJ (DUF2314 family)
MGLGNLFLALAVASASSGGHSEAARDRELILSVPLADPEMQAAVRRARAGLAGFFERLAGPASDEGEFMVAFDIIPGKDEELVWIDEIERAPGSVTGIIRTETHAGTQAPATG